MPLRCDPRLADLAQRVRLRTSDQDPGHDWAHLERVIGNCARLGAGTGADMGIVLAAALLHDLINVPKNAPDRAEASRQSAQAATTLLVDCGYADGEISAIARAIEEHSHSRGLQPSSLESAIVQDADRLDALGAIGIMRTLTCGALMGARYYHPSDPWATQRPLDDRRHTLDHFEAKLLKLAEGFCTETGRREAQARTAFMRTFLAQLRAELAATPPA